MSNKTWDEPLITAYALDELSGTEREKFEARIAKDPQLRLAVEQARDVMRQVTDAFAGETFPAGLSATRRAAVERAMLGDRPKVVAVAARPTVRSSRGWMKGLVLAASVALVGGIGFALLPARNSMQVAMTDGLAKNAATEKQVSESDRTLWGSDLYRDLAESVASTEQDRKPSSPSSLALPANMDAKEVDLASSVSAPAPAPVAATSGRDGVVDALSVEVEYAVEAEAKAAPLAKRPGAELARGGLSESLRQKTRALQYVDEAEVLGRGTAVTLDAMPELALKDKEAKFLDRGLGAGQAGDRFEPITDNAFLRVNEAPLSTFSIDVDTASYSKVRQYLFEANQMPRPDAVRIEEMVNYFDYDYAPPAAEDPHPFAVHVEVTPCPWTPAHRLARIALKGRELGEKRPQANLVFLLDVSGSMDEPNKMPLVIRGMKLLLGQLQDRDRVAIVVYAGAAGLVLDSTSVNHRDRILEALERLKAGGSTNGGQGIQLAYEQARDHFIEGGVNRVILCTDGDFNVGTTGTDALVRMVEKEAKGNIFLSVLGFGMGNHNDAMLEQISDRGNGNYAFIDTPAEARKVLVHQVTGTLVTIAKDVKLQIEFNPQQISGYRLIGYENRILAAQDFNDDKKDAGEIGAGHEVTALYELVPAGEEVTAAAPPVDDLKYQQKIAASPAADSKELLTVKLRYKQPEGDTSTLIEKPVSETGDSFAKASQDLRFAASVAGFGMQLRGSPHKGEWQWSDVLKVAQKSLGNDRWGLRSEFLELVQSATNLSGK